MITSATVNNSKIDRLLEDLDNISLLPMSTGCAWSGPFAVLELTQSASPTGLPTSSPTLKEDNLLDFEHLFDVSDEYLLMTPETQDCHHQYVSDERTRNQEASIHPSVGLGSPLEYSSDFDGLSFSVIRQLLKHYRQSVVELYTPALPTSESPWKVLYLPKVLGCIGEIMLSGDGPHVMMCLLFSILATSAYGMQVHEEQEPIQDIAWQDLGKSFALKAKARLKLALAQISTFTSSAMRYKDYLMALLSMVTIGVRLPLHHGGLVLMKLQVFSGEMKEARCYLLDAQRFVLRFGLEQSAKSRKVCMLHSIYLYLRVLEESTDIQLQEDQLSKRPGAYCGPASISPSDLRPSIWADDLTLSPNDTRYSSLISTEIQPACNIDPIAIFEQIYSIPASLFKLIAQATEVAREMEKIRMFGVSPETDVDILWTEVKILEQHICDWKNQYEDYGSDQTDGPPREALLYHLAEGIHAALMIFFYRRVRDMHSGAVQHWVKQTADHLLTVERLKMQCGDRSANLCWPGFIAGCEATGKQMRQQCSQWFERSYRDSRIRMFDVARIAMESVWRAKDTSGTCGHSWSEALRGATDSMRLVLS